MKDSTKNLIQIHVAVLLFGLSGLFGKFVEQPAVIITLGRVFFASVSMFLLFKFQHTNIRLGSKGDYLTLIAAGVILASHWTFFFLSVQVSTVAIAVLTFSTYPLFITFLEPLLFQERIRTADIVCALLMFIGVIVIVPQFQLDNRMTIGIIWGMISSLTYAVLSLINRKLVSKYKGTIVAFYEQSTATVVLLPAFFLIRPVFTPLSLGLLILLGVVFTATAHSMFIGGMKNVRAQTAGMISSLESVYGILAAAITLGEIPSFNELLGGTVILLTALYSTFKASDSPK